MRNSISPTSDRHRVFQPHRDQESFESLMRRLDGERGLMVSLRTWIGDALAVMYSAEDCWQDTIYQAWRDREAHEWRDFESYRAWVCGIARHRIRDAAQRAIAIKRGGLEIVLHHSTLAGDGSRASALFPPRETTPSRVAQGKERDAAIHAALDELPESLREVARLRLLEGLELATIMERTGLPLSTVWYRERKAASLLAARLGLMDSTESRCQEAE
ncbi:MAG: hypothetical protein KDB53_20155 [Planctomycetes bacterium]|nr:hypothetical protein [Planctomycetota bacterium]